MIQQFLTYAFVVVCFLFVPEASAKKKPNAWVGTFANMTKALKTKNQKLFKNQWHPKGYNKNLVGGSGIPGKAVYGQGSRKGWFLKPNFARQIKVSKTAVIVPCQIWSWRKKRAVDKVHALVIQHKGKWLVLGAGERLKQVQALAKKKGI